MSRHIWTVVFRNDVQGFEKQFRVQAAHLMQAITDASEDLQQRGYLRADFEVIEVKRGRKLRT